jgi:aspartyl protease family protein
MNGHLVAGIVWLGLIAGGYVAFDYAMRPAAVTGCEDGDASQGLRLTAAADGHYYLDGAIDGKPVRFVVDTGATTVTVGGPDANRIGLPEGEPAGFRTAAGNVSGRVVRGRSVRAGCFDLAGLSVAVSPPMAGSALLGQNFLRHFDVTMSGGTMVLRPRPDR